MSFPYWLSTLSNNFFVFSLNFIYITIYFEQGSLRLLDYPVVFFGGSHFLFDEPLQICLLLFHLGHLCLHHLYLFPLRNHIIHQVSTLLLQRLNSAPQLAESLILIIIHLEILIVNSKLWIGRYKFKTEIKNHFLLFFTGLNTYDLFYLPFYFYFDRRCTSSSMDWEGTVSNFASGGISS